MHTTQTGWSACSVARSSTPTRSRTTGSARTAVRSSSVPTVEKSLRSSILTSGRTIQTASSLWRKIWKVEKQSPFNFSEFTFLELIPRNFPCSSHVKEHEGKRRKSRAVCDSCGKVFCDQKALISHKAAQHGHEKGFRCKDCGKRFAVESRLKRHMLKHTDLKPFKVTY